MSGEERFRVVASTLADGVLVLDAGGRILFANHEAEELFGYAPAELVGGTADRLIAEGERDAHREGQGGDDERESTGYVMSHWNHSPPSAATRAGRRSSYH